MSEANLPSPAAELPPLRAEDALPPLSGKYVAIALFVGVMKFYWMDDGFLLGYPLPPEILVLALAQGGLATIAAMALYGRWMGEPYFREPGHWLALVVTLPLFGPFVDSFMPPPGADQQVGFWHALVLIVRFTCSLAIAVIGLVFLTLFFMRNEIFSSGAWRTALLILGVRITSGVIIGVGFVLSWIDYPQFQSAAKRGAILGLFNILAVAAALIIDARRDMPRHWTHTLAVHCWLIASSLAAYSEFGRRL